MSEWVWLLFGMAWGLWINHSDANHYKEVTKLQERLIYLFHNKRFLTDENWSTIELALHKERWYLQVEMDYIYDKDKKKYSELAKRYHEICAILDKE